MFALFLAPRQGRTDTTRLVAAIGNFFANAPRNGPFKNTVQGIKSMNIRIDIYYLVRK